MEYLWSIFFLGQDRQNTISYLYNATGEKIQGGALKNIPVGCFSERASLPRGKNCKRSEYHFLLKTKTVCPPPIIETAFPILTMYYSFSSPRRVM